MPALSGLGLNVSTANPQIAGGALAENFDTFLVLLTEQLKNQDPLSPLDSNEFVGQLVQFSGVEQQIAQNRNLESLIGVNAANSATSAVGFIGKEAEVLGTTAKLDSGQAKWAYASEVDAASVSLLVKDENGKIVFQTQGENAAGDHDFVWDGRDNAGNVLADGFYDLEASALDLEGNLLTTSVSTRHRITGADFTGTEPALLAGDRRIPFSNILLVREGTSL